LLVNQIRKIGFDCRELSGSGYPGPAKICERGKILRDMASRHLVGPLNRQISLRKPGEKLNQVGPVRGPGVLTPIISGKTAQEQGEQGVTLHFTERRKNATACRFQRSE
jgi:hypothetical protein